MQPQIGMRVIGTGAYCDNLKVVGKIGTIFHLYHDGIEYSDKNHFSVQFDENISGHRGDGTGKKDHCWDYYGFQHLRLLTCETEEFE